MYFCPSEPRSPLHVTIINKICSLYIYSLYMQCSKHSEPAFLHIWPGPIGTWVDCAFCPPLPYIRLVCVKNMGLVKWRP